MTIEASHPAFRAALGDLAAAADRLGGCRDRMAGEVGALLDGGWSGVAAEAFASGWEEWRAGAGEVLAGLLAMRDLVDRVHRDLTARDLAAAGGLAGVAGRLGR
ncbi:WXG100 family type VII secretion target [Nocardioides panaciterrulae]|uniref:WXG100 family type VII secretion target n=1 Tax=Nocardioides panaciterrulae TaxID=661492 RepID=A0A7Y9JBN0_9ACTN|nr:WXG100 family type VII secretion target [Nocardioides panaciterrulae]NYD43150.1 WXG100 family type VII secretion target [Nocardioides panaciterrulae]